MHNWVVVVVRGSYVSERLTHQSHLPHEKLMTVKSDLRRAGNCRRLIRCRNSMRSMSHFSFMMKNL